MGSNKNEQHKSAKTSKTPYSANPSKAKIASNLHNPEQYYRSNPSWNFRTSDKEKWAFTKEHIGDDIWDEIIPKLENLETQTWNEILLTAKKQNHSIIVENLNKIAQRRLADRQIEAASIISLRLSGTHRIYGYISGSTFNILWYDDNHGDNDGCVCKSTKKHT